MNFQEVFNVHKIKAAEFAESLGLVQVPIISFKSSDLEEDPKPKLTKVQKLKEKIKQKKLAKIEESKNKEKNLKQRLRENTDVLSERFEKLRESKDNDDDNEDLLVKKEGVQTHEIENKEVGFGISRRQLKKIKPDGHFEGRNKIKFDSEGILLLKCF